MTAWQELSTLTSPATYIYIQLHPVMNTINYIVLNQYIWQSLPRVTRPFSANSQHQAAQTIRHAASRATHRAAAWTTSSDKQLIHLYNWEHVRTFIWLCFFTQSIWETMLGNDIKLKLMLYFSRFYETPTLDDRFSMVSVAHLHTMVVLASCYDTLVMPSKWPYHSGSVTSFLYFWGVYHNGG